jgi:molybdate transport system substrate-binding protein
VGEVTARGETELAVQQISELMPVAGIDIVGPLPDEVQKISVFAAGIFRVAKNPDGAGRLISFLADARLAPLLIRKGLEPVRSVPLASDRRGETM